LISGDGALIRIGVPSVTPLTQVGVYLNAVKVCLTSNRLLAQYELVARLGR